MPDLASLLGSGLRFLTPLVLLWLAYFFGRTLRRGETPLIERIARRSTPDMSTALCRYTRGLTALWCAYFVVAATITALSQVTDLRAHARSSLFVWGGTVLLFVGERWLRPLLFPDQAFPGLLQQLRDTWSIWRPSRGTESDPPQ
jgi:uncharacterized membrane protein